MRVVGLGTLLSNYDIDKSGRAIRRRIREAREAAIVPLLSLSDFSSDKDEQVMERITLGDYARLGNLDKVAQGFQPANPVFFDIKNSVLTTLKENQYLGKDDEDRNIHLTDLLEACIIINLDGVSESDKQRRLFGYSLNGRAKDWLNAIPSGSITTWDQLKKAFLSHFFPTTKYMRKRREISSFQQEDGENTYEVWETYKLLLKGCRRHNFSEMEVTLIFTNGLKTQTRMFLDASAGENSFSFVILPKK